MSYPYSLAKGGAKDLCPACGHLCRKRTWKRYVDNNTGQLLPIEFGRCNRIESCGHKHSPYGNQPSTIPEVAPPKPISTHPFGWVTHSLQFIINNVLYQYLCQIFKVKVRDAFDNYNVGTIQSEKTGFRDWNGSCIFWYQNAKGDVLGGKVMQYLPTGKRNSKAKYGGITWLHSLNRIADFNLGKCLFGEHLLSKYPNKPIGIVESEKTAIIASICNDEYLWLATGGKSNIQPERFIAIADRKVVFFPDLGAEQEWIDKKNNLLRHLPELDATVITSMNAEISEWYLPDGFDKKGFDLADYYLLFAKFPDYQSIDYNPDANWDNDPTPRSKAIMTDAEFNQMWNFSNHETNVSLRAKA